MTIALSRELFDEMVAHARAGVPNEACGVIAGLDGRVECVFPMRNAASSPYRYRFEGNEQARVFNEIDERGMSLMGFFHSHTHTDAYPSPTDRAIAHWKDPVSGEEVPMYPGARYVIVSLKDEEPVLRAFSFEGGEPVEEELTIG